MADAIEAAARAYGKKFPLVDLGALVDALAAADAARLEDATSRIHGAIRDLEKRRAFEQLPENADMPGEVEAAEAAIDNRPEYILLDAYKALAALITAQAARIEALEKALKELLDANEADCGTPEICYEDDETVGASRRGDGTIEPMAMTFGMLRRARATLEGR